MIKNILSIDNLLPEAPLTMAQQPGKTLLDQIHKLDGNKPKSVGRLAFRAEGEDWVAYFAAEHTMEGAVRLGSIKMAIVHDKRRRNRFMDIMRDYVGEVLREKTGVPPKWRGETFAIK